MQMDEEVRKVLEWENWVIKEEEWGVGKDRACGHRRAAGLETYWCFKNNGQDFVTSREA